MSFEIRMDFNGDLTIDLMRDDQFVRSAEQDEVVEIEDSLDFEDYQSLFSGSVIYHEMSS